MTRGDKSIAIILHGQRNLLLAPARQQRNVSRVSMTQAVAHGLAQNIHDVSCLMGRNERYRFFVESVFDPHSVFADEGREHARQRIGKRLAVDSRGFQFLQITAHFLVEPAQFRHALIDALLQGGGERVLFLNALERQAHRVKSLANVVVQFPSKPDSLLDRTMEQCAIDLQIFLRTLPRPLFDLQSDRTFIRNFCQVFVPQSIRAARRRPRSSRCALRQRAAARAHEHEQQWHGGQQERQDDDDRERSLVEDLYPQERRRRKPHLGAPTRSSGDFLKKRETNKIARQRRWGACWFQKFDRST